MDGTVSDPFPHPPQDWYFNAEDRERHGDRFWQCPERLVTDRDWARLWQLGGCYAVTSVLPVLAFHTWPDRNDNTDEEWTGEAYLSRRRIARLAGVNKDSVAKAIQQLESAGWMETRRVSRGQHLGGFKTLYRLSTNLYPWEGEEYAKIPGNLFYSGAWTVLPTCAARHLFIVLAALDPIKNEGAYLNKLEQDVPDGEDTSVLLDYLDINPEVDFLFLDQGEQDDMILAALRARQGPLSLTDMETQSGIGSRGTVSKALQILTSIMFPGDDDESGIPLVDCGPCQGEIPEGSDSRALRWYAPNRQALWDWYFDPSYLNDKSRLKREQNAFLQEGPRYRIRQRQPA